MKKIFFLIILTTFSSCKIKLDKKCYDDWRMCHLIINKKEILNNNLIVNEFNVPYSKTTMFSMLNKPQVLIIYLDRNNFINAYYEVISDNKIKITSSERNELIGEYDVTLTEKTVSFPDIKALESRLILKSDKCSFYLKRHSAIN